MCLPGSCGGFWTTPAAQKQGFIVRGLMLASIITRNSAISSRAIVGSGDSVSPMFLAGR